MIIEDDQDVTRAVLSELSGAPDPRFREVMSAFVRHLHDFAREVRLTEDEFRLGIAYLIAVGQHSSESHNEAMLLSGSLGFSQLMVLLNHSGAADPNGPSSSGTDSSILGPFWRLHSPPVPNGGSLVRDDTPGPPLFATITYLDPAGAPVSAVEVDVWHSSGEGFYENQDPAQEDMNLRGRLTTDDRGAITFRTIMPASYPIPIDGPVGDLIRAQGRHNMRPAHLHFLAHKEGFRTLISQIFRGDDEYIGQDVQFAVTSRLTGDYVRHEEGTPPAPDVTPPWYTLDHTLTLEPGTPSQPRPPIQGKAHGPRPEIERLKRQPPDAHRA